MASSPAEKPLILVCNDDGITAPGLRYLIRTMNELGEVVVVAPDGPQSAMGHAITITGILRCDPNEIDEGRQREYACSGTPVDCAKLAVNVVLDRRPDLVVSGINHGSNLFTCSLDSFPSFLSINVGSAPSIAIFQIDVIQQCVSDTRIYWGGRIAISIYGAIFFVHIHCKCLLIN